ncbi:hypothetical protein AYI70_g119 [Smittium culicis]|uniref:DUF4291 domain-containing protein n=1 Tax=Smittium culicis TaxID=133412 RepID=A0A1R1YHW6_9FUNG|nr:hypothetical protein AYI70_g119 [Smittium culicis]
MNILLSFPTNQIRAHYTNEYIRVYQSYNQEIAFSAVQNQRFDCCTKYLFNRMTWIKPSWCWMAYRCGYSTKDENQTNVLAIDLDRKMFDEVILNSAYLASDQHPKDEGSNNENQQSDSRRVREVIIQWDPERDVSINKLKHRSIQIGLRYNMMHRYSRGEFIRKITDVTDQFKKVHNLVKDGKISEAYELLPLEIEYKVTDEKIKKRLQIS